MEVSALGKCPPYTGDHFESVDYQWPTDILILNINLHQEEDQEILLLVACSRSDLNVIKQFFCNYNEN